jgi:azurin
VCARILGALALLPLLTACLTPVAAEQITIKAVARPRPLSATALPAATATPAPIATPAPTATSAPAVPAASIGTNGGEWEFDVSELEIAAGQDVALTFNNGARSTLHNWLLIDGDEYAAIEINQAGEQAGEQAGYIPDDARIIARTFGLVKGGHSQTVTFTAPPAGTYIYLCTFPGHFEVGMRGVLTVR